MSEFTYEEVKYQDSLDVVSHIRRSDGWDIPIHEDNSMYKDYLKWKEAGNTPGEEIRE